MAELANERFSYALESTRGTLVTPPTDDWGMPGGHVMGQEEVVTVDENYGLLTDITDDDQLVRQWGEWSGEGVASTDRLPGQFNMAVKGGVTAPLTNNKVVASTTVGAGGSGYTTPPTVTVTGGTPKVPAAFTAVLTGDAVSSLIIVNPGIGYASAPSLGFTGGGGTGATATAAVATPTTAKLWEFLRTLTSDDLKSATIYDGDPNVQIFQSKYGMCQEMSLDGDASGTDLVAVSMNGISHPPQKVSPPTFPAAITNHYVWPKTLQLWIDAYNGNFGDTEIVQRVVSATLTIPTGVTPKYEGEGPGGTLTYTRVGRAKAHPTLVVVCEFLDTTQYDQAKTWGANTRKKVRVRWSGALIETASSTAFYHYVEAELYAKPKVTDWGDLEGTNRTLELTFEGGYLSTAATDLTVRVQGIKTTL